MNSNITFLKNRFLVLSLFYLCFFSVAQANSLALSLWQQQAPKEKKQEEKKEKKKSKYDELFSGKKVETKKGAFLTLHKTGGKIYVEMPLEREKQDLLIGATIASVSNPNMATIGIKVGTPEHYRFIIRDSAVLLNRVNNELLQINLQQQKNIQPAIQENFQGVTLYSYPVAAYSNDKKAVVFDMTPFFLNENKANPIIPEVNTSAYKINPSYNQSSSYIYQFKAFNTNAIVKVEKNFSVNVTDTKGNAILSNMPVTVQVAYTIMSLPEQAMTPRASDTRIGVFQTRKILFDAQDNSIEPLTVVNRWRVEPADIESFKRGEGSEPKKKITFYVDDAFPKIWADAIKNGVTRWNKAFEKIGFKNVMQAKDFPKNDPNFDPDNLEYSCIRYVPIQEQNAMGPSWVDPRSGEIINASTFVYADVAKLLANWRFVQTAQVDNRVRTKELPQELFQESLTYVIAHEIGHTLGFMHDMKASSSFAVDSLRSASFTQKYGTTPSIMDYARYNYIAQPQDKGVAVSPPDLGVYDYYLVEWTYKYFPELQGDFIKEAEELKKMVAQKETIPQYQYILQQFRDRLDPSAIEEDLGDDPEKASDYGFKNIKYILNHLPEWIQNDADSQRKKELYNALATQAYMYASNVAMNVGGIYLFQTSESSGLPRYKVVDAQRQRSSALWLLDKAKNITSSYTDTQLEQKMYPIGVNLFSFVQDAVQRMAISGISRVSLAYYLDSSSYTPLQYCQDVYESVFEKTLKGDENLTPAEVSLQEKYIDLMGKISKSTISLAKELSIINQETQKFMQEGIQQLTEHHLLPEYSNFCSFNNQDKIQSPNFGNGYGVPVDLFPETVTQSPSYILFYVQKTQELLQNVVNTTQNPTLKAHYQYLLKNLKEYLKNK